MGERVYHKEAFDRAKPEYRDAVLTAGIAEFSKLGLEKANINVIAKKAGVSVGLLYKYFETILPRLRNNMTLEQLTAMLPYKVAEELKNK